MAEAVVFINFHMARFSMTNKVFEIHYNIDIIDQFWLLDACNNIDCNVTNQQMTTRTTNFTMYWLSFLSTVLPPFSGRRQFSSLPTKLPLSLHSARSLPTSRNYSLYELYSSKPQKKICLHTSLAINRKSSNSSSEICLNLISFIRYNWINSLFKLEDCNGFLCSVQHRCD